MGESPGMEPGSQSLEGTLVPTVTSLADFNRSFIYVCHYKFYTLIQKQTVICIPKMVRVFIIILVKVKDSK